MAPRPAGVATATMVSSGANTSPHAILLARDDHRFHEGVADALRRDSRIVRDHHMHDAALVRVQRTELLRGAGVTRLRGHEHRHLFELGILVAAVAVAVHHDARVVAELTAERGSDEMLQ